MPPTSTTVGAGQTTQTHVTLDGVPGVASAYAIPDSCIARVSSTGLVTGIGGGEPRSA